jgi:hypothetical protein
VEAQRHAIGAEVRLCRRNAQPSGKSLFTFQLRAVHQAAALVVIGQGAVHGACVVPNHQVAKLRYIVASSSMQPMIFGLPPHSQSQDLRRVRPVSHRADSFRSHQPVVKHRLRNPRRKENAAVWHAGQGNPQVDGKARCHRRLRQGQRLFHHHGYEHQPERRLPQGRLLLAHRWH